MLLGLKGRDGTLSRLWSLKVQRILLFHLPTFLHLCLSHEEVTLRCCGSIYQDLWMYIYAFPSTACNCIHVWCCITIFLVIIYNCIRVFFMKLHSWLLYKTAFVVIIYYIRVYCIWLYPCRLYITVIILIVYKRIHVYCI